MQGVSLDINIWRKGAELLKHEPVGGGPAVFQQPRARQDEGSGADGAHAPHQRRSFAQPVHQRLWRLRCRGAASHQQGINAAALPQCRIRQQPHAGGGPHYRVRGFARDLDAVKWFCAAGLRM